MKTGCSSDDAAPNGPASLSSLAKHNGPVPSIFQLPIELVTRIFQFTLPSVDMLEYWGPQLLSYIRTLYTIRFIAKRSQEIVDGTPAFWKYVVSTRPPHVNETTIARSKNGPLTVIYSFGVMHDGSPQPSAEDFLSSLAHTFPRWSAYCGPVVSGYFHMPAAQLQTIALRLGKRSIGPLDLLGGSAKHLRHVDLYCIPVRWRTGLFAQLNVLKLVQMSLGEFKLTTTYLLEILRASPDLEHLELGEMDGLIDHPPSSPVITHTRLRCINIYHCDHSFSGAILRLIQAPSCTKFYVDEVLANGEEEHSTFLNEDLQNFKKVLLAIHLHNKSSKIILDGEVFGWNSLAKNFAEHLPKSNVWLCCSSFIPCIEWVEDILQDHPGLTVRFKYNATITQEVLQSIKPMRCVTRLEIVRSLWNDGWSLLVMKFIGEPL
ncbi:hypothetical protein FRC00_007559, partial [Tulasnella sp. 408]